MFARKSSYDVEAAGFLARRFFGIDGGEPWGIITVFAVQPSAAHSIADNDYLLACYNRSS